MGGLNLTDSNIIAHQLFALNANNFFRVNLFVVAMTSSRTNVILAYDSTDLSMSEQMRMMRYLICLGR